MATGFAIHCLLQLCLQVNILYLCMMHKVDMHFWLPINTSLPQLMHLALQHQITFFQIKRKTWDKVHGKMYFWGNMYDSINEQADRHMVVSTLLMKLYETYWKSINVSYIGHALTFLPHVTQNTLAVTACVNCLRSMTWMICN